MKTRVCLTSSLSFTLSISIMMIMKFGVSTAWSSVRLSSRRQFHQSTSLGLNRFLFDPSEIDNNNNTNNNDDNDNEFTFCSNPTVTLPKQDYRTIHAAKVLRLQNNDTLRAGIVQDNIIEMKTSTTTNTNTKHGNNKYNQTISDAMESIASPTSYSEAYGGLITDEATITWLPEGKIKKAQPTKNGDPPGPLQITLKSLRSPIAVDEHDNDSKHENDNENKHSAKYSSIDASSQISLILALPRPLALARLLPMISMMGVSHLVLIAAQKVPKDYFGSHLFRKPNEIRKLLIEGLCQAGDVKIPTVTVMNRLKPFVEDDLDTLFPRDEWARVIAHPFRKEQGEDPIRMDDIKFPLSSSLSSHSRNKILLAVGPEGGWAEPYELDLFKEHDFQQITLGTRILRSDVAVVSLLSLAHDVCGRRRSE